MENNNRDHIIILRNGEFSNFVAPLMTKISIPITIVLIFAIVQLIRLGLGQRNLIVFGGAIFSGIGIFGDVFVILWDGSAGRKHRGIIPMLIVFIGFLPYLFGCYLVFYEGFWSLHTIFSNFSITTIIYALFFIVTGYKIVYASYLLSEFERKVSKGLIIINPKDQT